ncbi:hypothetical protein QFC21_003391 [Naganishia friedmannii]|uniref:Uncharacterized protein n=1 Tax=Naganishia friedmannii TaxID=89922 RepID=A0ACC2VPS5_9TREE|nr:hypothetical protein QFC21_003391 [Naganishia friedmannii]
MATAIAISRSSSAGPVPRSDNAQQQQHMPESCPTCKQPLSSVGSRHAAFSPESLPSIPMLPSIDETGVSLNTKPTSSSPSLLSVNTSVPQNQDKQLAQSPHTVGEEKAKARARGWSMVDEDAEKATREITWRGYRKLVHDLSAKESDQEEGKESAVSVLKETLLKVLQEAEQLSNDHHALQHSAKELEMNLKIARSNLQLAEMNSEMLEEALRRGGEGFAGRMLPLPNHQPLYSNKTSIDTVRTEGSRPATPGSAAAAPAGRSTSMTVPSSGGGSAVAAMIPPQIVRRKSGSEAGQAVGSATATTTKPATPTAIPQPARPARPAMERSNTLGSTTTAPPPPSTSAGTGIGGFFRKNFDKRSSLLMQDLGLQNLRIPDLQNLPIPSPSAATRAEFFNSLGMSHTGGAASSSPNLAITTNGFNTGSPTTTTGYGSLSRSPLQPRPTNRGGWYDAAAPSDSSLGGASDAEVQKLRATLVATSKSVTTLKTELGAMKTAKAELEAELESLSQALFEEANKMVADERKKRAEKEQEAKEAIEEREALRRVVKLMEAEKAGRTAGVTTRDSDKGISASEASEANGASESRTEPPRNIPGGFPSSAGSDTWTDKQDALDNSTSIHEHPKQSTAEELEELMKRMEADFGKL